MIETPTTLILGAGASAPYGYPIGSQLKSDIISSLKEMLDNGGGWVSELGFNQVFVADFIGKFATSPRSSIDSFISYQKEDFIPIGKTAIVDTIVKSESQSISEPKDDHWYSNFAEKLYECPFEDIGNNIGIITYNYDRSLETYLYRALISSFSECDDPLNCNTILENIPIVHMYGRLDHLPWEQHGVRPYGAKCDSKQLQRISKNINLIQETEKKGTIDKANELLSNSKRVYFLGMDLYRNRSNIELLDLSLLKDQTIVSTAYKLENGEIGHIRNFFQGIQRRGNGTFTIGSKNQMSLRTIRYFNPF